MVLGSNLHNYDLAQPSYFVVDVDNAFIKELYVKYKNIYEKYVIILHQCWNNISPDLNYMSKEIWAQKTSV